MIIKTYKKIALLLADGFELGEATMVIDILKRSGSKVDLIAIKDTFDVKSNVTVSLKVDYCLSKLKLQEYDMLVLPGGSEGTKNILNDERARTMIIDFSKINDKKIGAICAAPSILGKLKIINEDNTVCCYPGYENELNSATIELLPSVIDGNIITGTSVGCVIDFALSLVESLYGKTKSDKISNELVRR